MSDVQHGGGYLLFPDGRSPGYVGADGRMVAQAPGAGGEPPASAVFSNSIDMLVGGGTGGGRGEGRMANWSDDGLPPPAISLPPGTAMGESSYSTHSSLWWRQVDRRLWLCLPCIKDSDSCMPRHFMVCVRAIAMHGGP